MDTHYNVTLTCALFSPYTLALVWLIIHLQVKFHVFQLLSNRNSRITSSSSQPVFPKETVSLHCSVPVMGATPSLLHNPNIIGLQLHTDLAHYVYSICNMH